MPSAADFQRAFGLEEGESLGLKKEWQITSAHVGHVVKEQNERYEFPTELTLQCNSSTRNAAAAGTHLEQRCKQLGDAFRQATREKRIVYSAYGSPYQCSYGPPKVTAEREEGSQGPSFRLSSLGKAARRRDVPTLKEQKQAEREAQGVAEVTREDERRYLGAYRVIKSRFGTSKCATCGKVIEPGVKICKDRDQGGRGGWSHAACVVQQMRQGAEGAEGEEEEEEEEGGEEGEREQEEEEMPQKKMSGGKRGRAAQTLAASVKQGRGRKAAAAKPAPAAAKARARARSKRQRMAASGEE